MQNRNIITGTEWRVMTLRLRYTSWSAYGCAARAVYLCDVLLCQVFVYDCARICDILPFGAYVTGCYPTGRLNF